MLDRTQPDSSLNAKDVSSSLAINPAVESPPGQGWPELGWNWPLGWLRRAGQYFFALSFSSLTRRIVSLNLAGLVALVASILYLSQFRAGLIDARAQSLLVQADI
ncbi:MAG TPA: sensor N-terminal transmembrane domain-containing protein, partial [Bradyrhizobium sp.]|nr:sensor N-terminal transmembrane domain-containing protein [Bradyrhizobium sp.]